MNDPDPAAFRRVMGLFATGVTVVAVDVPDGVHGMTANAVTSVSLDPLLVLVCIDRRARMFAHMHEGRIFSLNILRDTQETLSRYFAGSWKAVALPEFHFQRWEHGPLLVGALGTLGCRIEQVLDAGDHAIALSRVTGLHEGEPGWPLLFFGGRYRRLQEEEHVPAPADEWTHASVRIFYD